MARTAEIPAGVVLVILPDPKLSDVYTLPTVSAATIPGLLEEPSTVKTPAGVIFFTLKLIASDMYRLPILSMVISVSAPERVVNVLETPAVVILVIV